MILPNGLNPPQSPIGVALVGTGFGQKVHLPALQASEHTQVVAVYHRDLAKAETIARSQQIPHACDSLEQVLAIPEVQAVSISTPPFLHTEMAQMTLKAGKHLLLEKPTTLTVKEASALYRQAQWSHLSTAVNFEFRYVPAWQYLQELLVEGYVGQPRLIRVDWLVGGRADASRPWSWHSSKALGGGALGALGSHTFDYLAWLFGPIRQLCARLDTTIPFRPDPISGLARTVDADDTCHLLLQFVSGTTAQVCISFATHQGRGHWLEVYGDRGTLVLGSRNQQDYVHGFQLLGSQSGQPLADMPIPQRLEFAQVFPDGRIAPVVRTIEGWVKSMITGATVAPSLKEGVYSQLLMDLAWESHRAQAWVDVPELIEVLQAQQPRSVPKP